MSTLVPARNLEAVARCAALSGFLDSVITVATLKRVNAAPEAAAYATALRGQDVLLTAVAAALRQSVGPDATWNPAVAEDLLYEFYRAIENAIPSPGGTDLDTDEPAATLGHVFGQLTAGASRAIQVCNPETAKVRRADFSLDQAAQWTPAQRRSAYIPMPGFEWVHATPLRFRLIAAAMWAPREPTPTVYKFKPFSSARDDAAAAAKGL